MPRNQSDPEGTHLEHSTNASITGGAGVWNRSGGIHPNVFSRIADAIVPSQGTPEQKVQSILTWISKGPVRNTGNEAEWFTKRDPEDTLNYE